MNNLNTLRDIAILKYTPNPLSLMGLCASKCWHSKPSPRIGIECVESGHGRVLEYPDIIISISGYSARCIRELYTHIIGTTKLQESTRYVEYGDFTYYIPDSIANLNKALEIYEDVMNFISNGYKKLQDLGIPKQDIANILPFGSHTIIVLKINARAILHLAEIRSCMRALSEMRELTDHILSIASGLDDEWEKIIEFALPKCEVLGYCNEKHSCGKMPKKEEVIK